MSKEINNMYGVFTGFYDSNKNPIDCGDTVRYEYRAGFSIVETAGVKRKIITVPFDQTEDTFHETVMEYKIEKDFAGFSLDVPKGISSMFFKDTVKYFVVKKYNQNNNNNLKTKTMKIESLQDVIAVHDFFNRIVNLNHQFDSNYKDMIDDLRDDENKIQSLKHTYKIKSDQTKQLMPLTQNLANRIFILTKEYLNSPLVMPQPQAAAMTVPPPQQQQINKPEESQGNTTEQPADKKIKK